MRNNGNTKSNAIYNPNENKYPPPVSTMDGERDSEMEQYIRGMCAFVSIPLTLFTLRNRQIRAQAFYRPSCIGCP